MIFVRFGFYCDIPVPFTRRVIVFDAGWRRFAPRDWYSIWMLGWKYR